MRNRRPAFRILAVVLTVSVVSAPVIPVAQRAAAAEKPEPTPQPSPAGTGRVAIAELTPQVEKAIRKGLKFLAGSQNADGSWGSHKSACTGLALMAFMVKGHFPGREPYGKQLSKAVDYLLRQAQTHRGYMGRSMYEHGLATLALSEVWGMSQHNGLRQGLKSAVAVILRSQNPQGGWRYQPAPRDADMSVTVMQVVALASAKEAGIVVPDKVIQKALQYVHACQHKKSGGFGYQPGGGPNFPRSAAGVMSLMMCGERKSEAVAMGLKYLMSQGANVFGNTGHYYYGHYYAIQAMYQAGDKYFHGWYPKIRDAVLKKQNITTGQWPDGHNIGTPMAILILGVPYRFLPIYQR
jgi:hypothetical protein